MPQTPVRRRTDDRAGILGPAIVGAGLAATGLCFGLLAVSTPFATRVAGGPTSGSAVLPTTIAVWGLALIAAAGLLVAGTQRLAGTLSSIRASAPRRSIVGRAVSGLPLDIDVWLGATPGSGHPIPELVSGPFGLVVFHELGRGEALRRIGSTWEARTDAGWMPTEHPVDRAGRDAERVRHWLNQGDLDFVVRVYAAVVTADVSIPRSPGCAVLTEAQIPDWLAALPRQRSLTPGRRERLANRIARAIGPDRRADRDDRGW
jgi:hypothetical protein